MSEGITFILQAKIGAAGFVRSACLQRIVTSNSITLVLICLSPSLSVSRGVTWLLWRRSIDAVVHDGVVFAPLFRN